MRIPSLLVSGLPAFARIIGLALLAASLAGCSAIKLAYNNLDTVAYWWLDGYVDFTDEQAPRVRDDLASLQAWHRAQELPQLAAILQRMEQLAPGDVTPAQACEFVPALRERLDALAERAEPAVVTLGTGLSPEQLLHLQRKYENTNAEYRKDWVALSPAELRDKRFKQFLERSEMIYGPLEEAQHAVLRRQLEESIFDPARWMAERQRRQQDMLNTLRKIAGRPVAIAEARDLMRGYLERLKASPDPETRSYQQALIEEACRSFSALHNSTNAAQREAAARRLRAYQRDLRELSAQR